MGRRDRLRKSPGSRLTRLGLATLLLASALFIMAPQVLDRDKVVVEANTLVNPPGLVDANNSPSLARNPQRPDEVVIAHRVDQPAYSALLHWSPDGGVTWRPTPLSLPPGSDRAFAPDVAFGPDGTLFVTYLNLTGNGNVPANLWVARSSDGGRTMSAPVRVTGALAFQPRLAVGGDGGVFVTWLQANEVGVFRLAGAPARVVASRSADGGQTFTAPVPVSDVHRERVGAATPLVVRNQVLVVYKDFKDDRRDFENLDGPPWDRPFALVLARSEDGGATFSTGSEIDSDLVPTQRFLVFLPEFPSIAAAEDATLYVAWSDGRNGDEDVFLRRSGDGGVSWSGPIRVNDNPRGDRTSQRLPRVSVAPGGRVDVLFHDRRRDRANHRTDAYLAFSHEGGPRFRNLRLSERSFDARVGPDNGGRWPIDLGSRLALGSHREGAIAAWTDTRLGNESSGRQDIVASRVQVPPSRDGEAVGLGAAIALLLAGAVVIITARASGNGATRRGSGDEGPTAGERPAAEPQELDRTS